MIFEFFFFANVSEDSDEVHSLREGGDCSMWPGRQAQHRKVSPTDHSPGTRQNEDESPADSDSDTKGM